MDDAEKMLLLAGIVITVLVLIKWAIIGWLGAQFLNQFIDGE